MIVVALIPRGGAAQTGTVVGRVTNAVGAPVTAAQVTITGMLPGSAVDAEGKFRFANVPAGGRGFVAR
jgi:hypothetical protein